MSGRKLTPKQRLFIKEYLVDLNATQAAIRAGYSVYTANEQGSRLLANVSIKSAIKEEMDKRAKRTEIDIDRVLLEYRRGIGHG
jgi:phage terminase small subunit